MSHEHVLEDGEVKVHEGWWATRLRSWNLLYLFFVIGLVQGAVGGSLAVLQTHVGATEAVIGTLVLARGVGWLCGSLAAGLLFARFDAHRLLLVALAAMVAAHLAVPFVTNLDMLWALFVAIGVAGGMMESGGNTALIWLWREEVGPYLQFLNFAVGFGALVSPLIMAAFLLEESAEFSVVSSYVSLAVLMIPAMVVLAAFRGPKPPVESKIDGGEGEGKEQKRSLAILVSMSLFALFISGIEVSSGSWLALFTKNMFGWTLASSDLSTSVFYGGFTIARLIFSLVPSKVVAPQRVLFLLTALLAVGVGLLFVASFVLKGGLLVFGSIGLLGFGLGPLFACGMSLPIDSPMRYLLSARDVAVVVSTSNAGELLTPLAISLTWSLGGPKAYLLTTAGMTVGTFLTAVALYWASFKSSASALSSAPAV